MRVVRHWLLGTVVAGLCFAAGCSEEPDKIYLVGGECVPGAQVPCACSGGGQGAQVCNPLGTGFGACDCSGVGSCTVFPDCSGCSACYETCICHSSGDVTGCARRCANPADGGGSGGSGGGGNTCVPADCPPAPIAQIGTPCCSPNDKCGLEVSFIGAGCIERDQPGTPDPDCPSQSFSGFNLAGCCRPDGKCGVRDTFIGLGCVDITAVTGGTAQRCD